MASLMADTQSNDFLRDIPTILQKDLIYHTHIFFNRKCHYDLVLTQGPILYETQAQHILSICDLSTTVLMGTYPIVTARNNGKNTTIQIDVKFAHSRNVKEVFYLIRIDSYLVITHKQGDELIVIKQFRNIEEYETLDENNTGEISLRLQTSSFREEAHIQLNRCLLKETSNTVSIALSNFHKSMSNRISKRKTNVKTAKASLQKIHSEMIKHKYCNTEEDRVILVKNGNIWLRNNNDKIIIGIPLYNSSIEWKAIVQNIQVSLFCPQKRQLNYTGQLYRFGMDNDKITLSDADISDLLRQNEKFSFPEFDQEWLVPTVGYGVIAAVVVVTIDMDFMPFTTNYTYDCFILYNAVIDENEPPKELQMYAGRKVITPNIFHDNQFRVDFTDKHVYMDLLAVTATSSKLAFKITLKNDEDCERLKMFITDKLKFNQVGEHKSQPTMCNGLLHITQATEAILQDRTDVFYKDGNDYWSNTLIQIGRREDHRAHQIIIYNSSNRKLLNFMLTLEHEFGRNICITPSDIVLPKQYLRNKLKHSFKEEARLIEEMSTLSSCDGQRLLQLQEQLAFKQFQVDLICNQIKDLRVNS